MNQDKRNRRYVEKARRKHYGKAFIKMTDDEWACHKQYNAPLPVGLTPNIKRFFSRIKTNQILIRVLIYLLGVASTLLVAYISHALGWNQ